MVDVDITPQAIERIDGRLIDEPFGSGTNWEAASALRAQAARIAELEAELAQVRATDGEPVDVINHHLALQLVVTTRGDEAKGYADGKFYLSSEDCRDLASAFAGLAAQLAGRAAALGSDVEGGGHAR